jgi:PEP-CTERM motif
MASLMKSAAVALSSAALLLSAAPAAAATYISYLEYWNGVKGSETVALNDPLGDVLIEELPDGNSLKITATLYDGAKWQQSGKNDLFGFSLADDGNTVVAESYSNVLHDSNGFERQPYGTFTDSFYAFEMKKGVPERASGANGRLTNVFEFTLSNSGGMTFAGSDAVYGLDGKLLAMGTTGNRLVSNEASKNTIGGWWFVGHFWQPNGNTFNIAARDAFCVDDCGGGGTSVPEPSTWALMLIGFGGAGALIRRRRYAAA